MSELKTFSVKLITRGVYVGAVEAKSQDDAIDRSYHLWCNIYPHPFQQTDDELLVVTAEEVRP
jgi:hypothetical protein